jgi:hypothetical protein
MLNLLTETPGRSVFRVPPSLRPSAEATREQNQDVAHSTRVACDGAGVVVVPVWLIQPFRIQTPRAVQVSYALTQSV